MAFRVHVGPPTIEVIAEMGLNDKGVLAMAAWVARNRPECVPKGGFTDVLDLLPHEGEEPDMRAPVFSEALRRVTDNELLAELAGRTCYHSFAEKGAPRSNREYLYSMWQGRIPHRSTGYHPKMSFFFADISRRVSHELIRNYVGADRDEEGSPSQESTRFTEFPGTYIAHPEDIALPSVLADFHGVAADNFERYTKGLAAKVQRYRDAHGGRDPKGLDRKRTFEACSGWLLHSIATSFVWTTNPMALCKLFVERVDEAADMEMRRFAAHLCIVCIERWPNLFVTLPSETVALARTLAA